MESSPTHEKVKKNLHLKWKEKDARKGDEDSEKTIGHCMAKTVPIVREDTEVLQNRLKETAENAVNKATKLWVVAVPEAAEPKLAIATMMVLVVNHVTTVAATPTQTVVVRIAQRKDVLSLEQKGTHHCDTPSREKRSVPILKYLEDEENHNYLDDVDSEHDMIFSPEIAEAEDCLHTAQVF